VRRLTADTGTARSTKIDRESMSIWSLAVRRVGEGRSEAAEAH
jgi:hypothetical protein